MMRRKPGWLQDKWQWDAKATRIQRKAQDILRGAQNHLRDTDRSSCPIDLTPENDDALEIIYFAEKAVNKAHDEAQAMTAKDTYTLPLAMVVDSEAARLLRMAEAHREAAKLNSASAEDNLRDAERLERLALQGAA